MPTRGVGKAQAKAPRSLHSQVRDGPHPAPRPLRARNQALLITVATMDTPKRVTIPSPRQAREVPLSAPQGG